MDLLFNYINANSNTYNVKIFYSAPDDYAKVDLTSNNISKF